MSMASIFPLREIRNGSSLVFMNKHNGSGWTSAGEFTGWSDDRVVGCANDDGNDAVTTIDGREVCAECEQRHYEAEDAASNAGPHLVSYERQAGDGGIPLRLSFQIKCF